MPNNILLIMTDQHRNDYVGYMGSGKIETPNIDRIAAKAYFSNCITPNPICTPARCSLISGRYPRQIGMLTMSGDYFPQIPTFMQALKRAGYKTYGIGKYHYMHMGGVSVARGHGYDHTAMRPEMKKLGYDFVWETAGKQTMVPNFCDYGKYLKEKGLLKSYRDFALESGGINGDSPDHNYDKALPSPLPEEDYIDNVTARIAIEQLSAHPKNCPFYMFISFCGPHKPYDAPKRYLDMFPEEEYGDYILEPGQCLSDEEKKVLSRQRRSYKAMISLIDDRIGDILSLLKEREMDKNTMVIFASDHGDMLGDHYRIQKGVPWKQATNVPLAIYVPGYPVIGRNPHPVQLFDVAATVLDYAGIDPVEGLSRSFPAYNNLIPAQSLLPVLRGKCDKIRNWAYSESDFTEEVHPWINFDEVLLSRGANGKRSNGWRMITDERFKYVKYLGYDEPGTAYEELYDLTSDPNELKNIIGLPKYSETVRLERARAEFITDHYPPAQLCWANSFSDGAES